jgi:protein arginine N-methyltransferase 1
MAERPTAYSVRGYGEMMADHVRMAAYVGALRRHVGPESVVLDLGAGTGIMSLIAAKLGARRVYAVEPSPALQLAREAARANGLERRIEFFEAVLSEVDLAEPANLLVSDLRGILPLYERHIPTICDARRRLLVPGATIIPREDSLWAAVVDARETHESILLPWAVDAFGLDLSAGRSMVTGTLYGARLKRDQLLSPPLAWETLDYTTREQPDARGDLCFEIARPGAGHGIAVWFDSILTDGVSITNAPNGSKLIYGQMFLPWPEAVSLEAGDRVAVSLRANLVDKDYVWRWETSATRGGRAVARFEQSTLDGAPLSPESLRRRSHEHVPVLTEDGKIDRDILVAIDGRHPLGEIARFLVERWPRRFDGWKAALRRVTELEARYR